MVTYSFHLYSRSSHHFIQHSIKFDKLSRATRLWQGSDSNVVLLPCQTKFINYINVFWRDCVPAGRTGKWLQQSSENPEFGTTLARRLNQSRASAVLQST